MARNERSLACPTRSRDFTTNGEPDDAGEPGGAAPQVYQRDGYVGLIVAVSLEQFGRLLSGFGDCAGFNARLGYRLTDYMAAAGRKNGGILFLVTERLRLSLEEGDVMQTGNVSDLTSFTTFSSGSL
jgi:hypothetical protein